MSQLRNDIDCYILAGGKSSRMGIDKGLLKVNNKALIEYVLETVQPLFKKCVIVTKNKDYEQFVIEIISDLIEDVGPAGGIYTALQHTKAKKIFVISCDMPNIRKEAIEFILEKSSEYEVVVPIHEKKFEPLFAIYSKSCISKWKQELDKGSFKLQNIISNFKVLELDVTHQKQFSNNIFMNLNTQEDLELFVSKLKNGN